MSDDIARTLIVAGMAMITAGVFLYVVGKIPGIGKLPGDIFIKKENFTFYMPLVTCLLISLLVSLLFFLWNQK